MNVGVSVLSQQGIDGFQIGPVFGEAGKMEFISAGLSLEQRWERASSADGTLCVLCEINCNLPILLSRTLRTLTRFCYQNAFLTKVCNAWLCAPSIEAERRSSDMVTTKRRAMFARRMINSDCSHQRSSSFNLSTSLLLRAPLSGFYVRFIMQTMLAWL
jgi:hypothetical protein